MKISLRLKLIFILIILTFFAYMSSLGNPFIWDDEQFITSNVYVQNFNIQKIFITNTVAGAGVVSNYYRPVTTLSFAIDTKIWGSNPFGFHLTNLLLHIGAGLVLFGLLGELGISELGSFFIALLFLIHPIQTEAVTYINSRGDSLYALFLFASLFLFSKLQNTKYKILNTALVVFLFILSLLSKEIALAGLGLYILIFLYVFFHKKILRLTSFAQDDNIKKGIAVIGSIAFIIFLYLLLRVMVLRFANIVNFYGLENEYTRSLLIRLYTFCKVLWIYFGLLMWPYPLHMERSIDLVRSFFSPWVIGMLGLLGVLGLLGIIQLRKGNPWIIFGSGWFLIMLIPSSGIIPINGILYEHWLYVSMIGFFIGIYGILGLLGKLISKFTLLSHLSPFALLSPLIILYIILTIHQNNIWSDPISFYRYTLQFAPWSARLHNNLAISYANIGQIDNAIVEYKKGLAINPSYPQIHYDLANAYVAKVEYQLAKKEYQEALRLAPGWILPKRNLEALNRQK